VATDWEREQADRLSLHIGSSASLCNDPAGTTASALEVLPPGPLAVHVDVDVLDFTDAPLAENTDGRNTGPNLEQLREVLGVAARDVRFRALSMGASRRTDTLAGLSGREREVLALMAEGRTNSAIAASLVISEGAAEKHVANIFSKLDLPATSSDHRRVLAVLRYLEG
jgi:DNA-binding CsgD family transcriptional regulator